MKLFLGLPPELPPTPKTVLASMGCMSRTSTMPVGRLVVVQLVIEVDSRSGRRQQLKEQFTVALLIIVALLSSPFLSGVRICNGGLT